MSGGLLRSSHRSLLKKKRVSSERGGVLTRTKDMISSQENKSELIPGRAQIIRASPNYTFGFWLLALAGTATITSLFQPLSVASASHPGNACKSDNQLFHERHYLNYLKTLFNLMKNISSLAKKLPESRSTEK